jgi:putative FmdB family regulatory protein
VRTYNRSVPTYEYACQSCGYHVEVYQRFSDPALTKCEVCGGPLRKVFHPAGILFKGSGFYSTDSKRSASKAGSDQRDRAASSEAGSDQRDRAASSEATTSSGSGKGSSSDGSAAARPDKASPEANEASA